jgi:hypothetical protein
MKVFEFDFDGRGAVQEKLITSRADGAVMRLALRTAKKKI